MERIDPERGTNPRKAVPRQTPFAPVTWRHGSGDVRDAGGGGGWGIPWDLVGDDLRK